MIYMWFTGFKTMIIWPLRKIVTPDLYDDVETRLRPADCSPL
jgi:hypothetical protein